MHPGKDGQRTDIFTNGFSGANSADDCSVILNDNSMRSPDLTNTVIFPSLHGEKKPDDEPSSYLSFFLFVVAPALGISTSPPVQLQETV